MPHYSHLGCPALPTFLSHSSLRGSAKLCLPPNALGGVSACLTETDLGLWSAVGSVGFSVKGSWEAKDISLKSSFTPYFLPQTARPEGTLGQPRSIETIKTVF